MHIKPHFLFKLTGFAGVWHLRVILCFGGFPNVTAVLHSPVRAEVHKDSGSEGSPELLPCARQEELQQKPWAALGRARSCPALRGTTAHSPAEPPIQPSQQHPRCTFKPRAAGASPCKYCLQNTESFQTEHPGNLEHPGLSLGSLAKQAQSPSPLQWVAVLPPPTGQTPPYQHPALKFCFTYKREAGMIFPLWQLPGTCQAAQLKALNEVQC